MVSSDIDLGLNDRADLPCPRCGIGMKKIFITQRDFIIAVDHCIECEGYWFDSEELNSVIEDKNNLIDGRTEELLDEGEHLRCPRCSVEMETQYMFDVIIDKCHECEGIWLDRGELYQIQKKFRNEKNENILIGLIEGMT
ncbi:MAG: zf-TFIIB domain-containing protein [Thermoplasmatota archaeon]